MATKVSHKGVNEIPLSARPLVRHAYDQVITHTARLASYCASQLVSDWPEIEDRKDELARDDLIAFALHVRRLIETADIKKKVGNNIVTAFVNGKNQPTPIIKVINTIIHNQRLDILRR